MKRKIDWKKERLRFNEAAEIYDLYRPSYPPALIADLMKDQPKRVLEIGAGSGKATRQILPYCKEIDCIEPGPDLVEWGSKNFSGDSKVTYFQSDFESFETTKTYDLIMAGQSFHWIERPFSYQQIKDYLSPEGSLGVFWNRYLLSPSGIGRALKTLCEDYQVMYFMTHEELTRSNLTWTQELREEGGFGHVTLSTYPWQQEMTKEDFMNFLLTSNGYISLNEALKEDFDHQVGQLFKEVGGTFNMTYMAVLFTAKKG